MTLTTDYGYDKLDRLTQANPDTTLQALGLPQELYSYDAVGNRTASGHQPGSWTYNADNQLTQYPGLKPFSLGAQSIDTQVSYTPQGHMQQETSRQGQKDYRYNAAERLIHLSHTLAGQTTPNLEADYRYDPFGRRISKTITQGANTRTSWFIYGAQGLMAEANEQGKLVKSYGFNPISIQQGLWSTDPLWQADISDNQLDNEQTAYHYLHTDHLSTPMLATDKEGATSWKSVQESFGAVDVQPQQSRISMNLRFPGQYYDQETGTYYNFHRDYQPSQGRYVQSDPMGLSGGLNIFVYSNNNALLFADSRGHMAQCVLRPRLCSVAVVKLGTLIGETCAAAVIFVTAMWVVNERELTEEEEILKEKEYQAYKWRCDREPNPYSETDKCAAAKWEKDRLNECIQMRRAWDQKWGVEHHPQAYVDYNRRLKKAERILNSHYCCEKCD